MRQSASDGRCPGADASCRVDPWYTVLPSPKPRRQYFPAPDTRRVDASAPTPGRTVTCGLPPLNTRGRRREPQKARSLRADVNDAPNTQYPLRATATTSNNNYTRPVTTRDRNYERHPYPSITGGRSYRDASPPYRPQSHLPPRHINAQPRRANRPQAQSIDHSRHKVTWCARLRKLRGKLAAIHRMPSCGQ
jgi:hypothetical protein